MPINGAEVRRWYQSDGPREFVHKFHQMLGLPGPNTGRRICTDETGHTVLESQRLIDPGSVSIKDLAVSIIGPTEEEIDLALRIPAYRQVDVLEAGTEIVPSQFANISAFNAAVAGLLEARILQAYSKSKFQAAGWVENVPTKLRSIKYLGVSNIGDVAQERKPGDPHARAQLSERYVTTPETKNFGIAIDVTREAVLFDYSRQLLQQADTVGDALALRKEYKVLDVILGIVNTYNYDGTSYNTYLTSGNWVNDLTNALTNYDSLNVVLQAFIGMTDPETGQPISIDETDVLVMPAAHFLATSILQAENIHKLQNALAGGSMPQDVFTAPNPVRGMFNLFADPKYPYAYRRVLEAIYPNQPTDAAKAKGLWYVGDFKGAFGWNENLPLTTLRANAADYAMADKGLVFSIFCDEMGEPFVKEPRKVIRCKAA